VRTRQMMVGDTWKEMVRKVITVVMRMDQNREEAVRWSLACMPKNTSGLQSIVVDHLPKGRDGVKHAGLCSYL
jgi:hypothetical protein